MPHADPSLSVAQRVDAACDRFEAEWKAGRRPRVDDYLAAAPQSDREPLRQALTGLVLELQGRGAADTSASGSSVRTSDKPPIPTAAYIDMSAEMPTAVGRFQLRSVLGSGAFGKVYRAFDPQLGREVALKVPLQESVETETDRRQFLREARSAATINHPNVCQIHEVGEHAGRPYIVMALVPGQSLADLIQSKKKPLPEKQSALIVRKIALALAAAHSKGIVHRDLKPANVMFDKERKDVVVMDFGLARGPKVTDARATQSGVIMGTPAYMSPEQARGDSKTVGPAADIFSLGVILYELLTGTKPFQGTALEVIGQIVHVEPEPASKRRPGIDPRLEAICQKAMAKDPAARFASMKEFAASIDAALRVPSAAGTAAETTKPEKTRQGAEHPGTETLGEVFAAFSVERRQARAETAAVVEAAIARYRTPRWMLVLFGVLLLGGLTALGGIILFAKTRTATVLINVDVDLSDKTLSFFLDGKPVSAEELDKPVELTLGEHELVVKRGKEVVKRILFGVRGGNNPSIEIREVQEPPQQKKGPPVTPKSADADRTVAEWALRHKAELVFVGDGKERRIATPDQLPGGRFKVIGVYFPDLFDVTAAGGLQPLKGLPQLRDLGLFNAKLNDDDLRAIEGMTSLRTLNLHGTLVTDASMATLATLPNLEILWLHYRPITDAGIAKIAGLKKLKQLLLRRTNVGPEGLKVIGGFSNLESLDVSGTQVTDDSLANLAGLDKLKHLEIAGTPLTGSGLKHVAGLPALTTLQVGDEPLFAGNGSLTDDGLGTLANFKALRDLYVGDSNSRRLTDATLRTIGKLINLEALTINVPQATDAGIEHLKTLTLLFQLRLGCPRMTDGGLVHIAPLHRLTVLSLNGTSITGSGFVELKKLPQLVELQAFNTPLGDAGVEHLMDMRNLVNVYFGKTKLTDRALEVLAKIPSLRRVEVQDTAVTDAGLRKFKAARPECAIVPEPKENPEVGFVPLFNGKDLTGWSPLNLNYTKDKGRSVWAVDPQRQVLAAVGGDFQDLQSDRRFKEFSLRLEWRFTPGRFVGANGSGIVVRSKGLNSNGPLAGADPQGVEIDLRPQTSQNGEKGMGTGCFLTYGTSLTNHRGKTEGDKQRHLGWLRAPAINYNGEWNSCEITCQGDRIKVSMNGKLINEAWEAEQTAGRIVLRSQNTAVEFRNICIKELAPPDEDRNFAEWLFSIGARDVWVSANAGPQKRVTRLVDLPPGSFAVTSFDIWNNENVTDANSEPILRWLKRSGTETLGLDGTAIGDATVAKLVEIKTLKRILLSRTKVTSRSLELLASRPDWKLATFYEIVINDAHLAHIRSLIELETLGFSGPGITDQGMKHLVGLKNLRSLGLDKTKVTADGLRQLRVLPIEDLSIYQSALRPADLGVLKEFASLRNLNAGNMALTNAATARLAELKGLEKLHLGNNNITDEGLQNLAVLTGLKELSIVENPVSEAGLAKLRKALPGCRIFPEPKAPK